MQNSSPQGEGPAGAAQNVLPASLVADRVLAEAAVPDQAGPPSRCTSSHKWCATNQPRLRWRADVPLLLDCDVVDRIARHGEHEALGPDRLVIPYTGGPCKTVKIVALIDIGRGHTQLIGTNDHGRVGRYREITDIVIGILEVWRAP